MAIVRLPVILDTGVSEHHLEQLAYLELRGILGFLLLREFEVLHALKSTEVLLKLIFFVVEPIVKLLAIVTAIPLFLECKVFFICEDLWVWLDGVDKGPKSKCHVEVKGCSDAFVLVLSGVNDDEVVGMRVAVGFKRVVIVKVTP